MAIRIVLFTYWEFCQLQPFCKAAFKTESGSESALRVNSHCGVDYDRIPAPQDGKPGVNQDII